MAFRSRRPAYELGALIGIEDLGLAISGKRCQNLPAEPVDDGRKIDEVPRHGDIRDIHPPDLIGPRHRQLTQEIREDRVPGRRLGES